MRSIKVAYGAAALSAGAALFLSATMPQAAVMVVGQGLARTCSEAAERPAAAPFDVETCTRALQEEMLNERDRSATLNNRGVLLMRMGRSADALRDFEAAMRLRPELGEAWVNRGAVRITEERYAEALADTQRALTLELNEPARAYLNRGIAHEELGRVREAYADYRRASELRPEWEEARLELARFQVR